MKIFSFVLGINKYVLFIFALHFIFSPVAVYGEAHSTGLSVVQQLTDSLMEGDVQKTKTILNKHPELLNAPIHGFHSFPPLVVAIIHKMDELFSFLVFEKKADVNVVTDGQALSGLTPLYLAAYNCRPEMVQVLVENGADIDVEPNTFFTPFRLEQTSLGLAVEGNCLSVADILLENGADSSVRVGPYLLLGHTQILRWPLKAKEYSMERDSHQMMAALLSDWEIKRSREHDQSGYKDQQHEHDMTPSTDGENSFCHVYQHTWLIGEIALGNKNKAKECLQNQKWDIEVFSQCKYLAYSYEEATSLYNRKCLDIESSKRPNFKDTNLRQCMISVPVKNCIGKVYKYLISLTRLHLYN